jgi:perosamine synthetase
MKDKIYFSKPSITKLEIDYVTDAITYGWGDHCYDYIQKYTHELSKYFGVAHVVPTSSCHGALHTILMALNIQNGDEVIVPDMTWIGSVAPISWLGATPVFVDVDPISICIDPSSVERSITEKTKAIIVVHPYGNVADITKLMQIAKNYDVPIIEDAAEAIGSEYQGMKAGSIADFGVISTHGTKIVTTGEGGAILSNRMDHKDLIDMISNQGRKPSKQTTFWVDALGLKYKISNIQAALGLAQFKRIQSLVDKKRMIFQLYKNILENALDDITLNPEPTGVLNSFWLPTIILGPSYNIDLEKRNSILSILNNENIGVRPIFYPVSGFDMYKTQHSNTVSFSIFFRGFNLPSYFDLTEEQVISVCNRFIKEVIKLKKK